MSGGVPVTETLDGGNAIFGNADALARVLDRWSRSIYRFREEAAFVRATLLVLGFAALTGVCAQLVIPLPFTPVPVTGQVFGVLLSGAVLGRRLGPLSQGAYLGLGAIGLPWFAPPSAGALFTVGGWAVLVGATGGYLIGFVVAAAVVGYLIDRGRRRRTFSGNLLILLGGVGIIYAIGSLQLAAVAGLSPREAILYGAVPFLPGDMLKCVLAAVALVAAVPASDPSSGPGVAAGAGRRRDEGVLVALLLGVWLVAGIVAGLGEPGPLLLDWYLLAAAVATGAALAAYRLRSVLGRPGARSFAGAS
jgi:biotin transport system substrate-specific component